MSYYKSVPGAGRHHRRSCLAALAVVVLVAPEAAVQGPVELPLTARWTVALPAPPAQHPAVSADLLVVPLRTGRLVGLALDKGVTRWDIELAASGPLVTGERTVIVPTERFLVGVDTADGAIRWRVPAGAAVSGRAALVSDTAVLPLADGSLAVVRFLDGVLVGAETVGAAPLVMVIATEGRLVIAASDGMVTCLDGASRAVLWRARVGGVPTTMAAAGRHLFVGSEDDFLYSLDAVNGRQRWRWQSSADVVGTPLVDAGRVYYLALDNQLRALDRGNGHQRWRRSLPIRPAFGPVRFQDWLIVAGLSPEIRAYLPATGEPAGIAQAPDELAGPPIVVPGDGGSVGLLIVTAGGQIQLLESSPATVKKPPDAITRPPSAAVRPRAGAKGAHPEERGGSRATDQSTAAGT